MEYKYVVCGGDGEGAAWKPGGNFVLSMPTGRSASVKIRDAWDESSREVQVSSLGDCRRRGGYGGCRLWARRRSGGAHSGSHPLQIEVLQAGASPKKSRRPKVNPHFIL